MASLLELRHDLARADTTAAVLAAARDAFAYALELTSLHGAAPPVPAPAPSASDVADELGSGDLARLCMALAARLSAEATHVVAAADRDACQQAAAYAAEIAALLPGSRP